MQEAGFHRGPLTLHPYLDPLHFFLVSGMITDNCPLPLPDHVMGMLVSPIFPQHLQPPFVYLAAAHRQTLAHKGAFLKKKHTQVFPGKQQLLVGFTEAVSLACLPSQLDSKGRVKAPLWVLHVLLVKHCRCGEWGRNSRPHMPPYL